MPLQPNYSEEELKAHYACLAELNGLWMAERDWLGWTRADKNLLERKAELARAGKLLPGMPETPAEVAGESMVGAFFKDHNRDPLCPCKACVQARAAEYKDTVEFSREPLVIHSGGPGASIVAPITLGPITAYCSHCGLEKGHTWVCPVHPQRAVARAHGLRKAAAPKLPDYDAILATRRAEREAAAEIDDFTMACIDEMARDGDEQAAAQTLERALSFDQHDRDFAVKARLGQR